MTKDNILNSALQLYATEGYHGASMAKIAKGAGIKAASIYFFFKNKEALFQELFQHVLMEHFAYVRRRMEHVLKSGEDVETMIRTLLSTVSDYHRRHAAETRAYIALVTAPPIMAQPILKNHMQSFDQWLTSTLALILKEECLSTQEYETISELIVLQMDGLFWELNFYDDEKIKKQTDVAVRFILFYLKQLQD